jgi:hypothetical protein
MPGLTQLRNEIYPGLVDTSLDGMQLIQSTEGDYLIDRKSKIIILRDPYKAGNTVSGSGDLITTKLTSLNEQIKDFLDYHVITPLIGNGVTERHITTLYLKPNRHDEPIIFDSKTSDAARFIGDESQFNKAWGVIKGIGRALFRPNYKVNSLDGTDLKNINYQTLGTQSYFDPITCGHHTLLSIKAITQLIKNNAEVNTANIKMQLDENPSLGAQLRFIQKADPNIKMNYFDFIKYAWHETFMPTKPDYEREQYGFKNYFMGWPKEGGRRGKLFYLFTLGFIYNPLANLIKIPTEFLLKSIAESFDFLRHRLMTWAPTSAFGQYFRTFLLITTTLSTGLFEGLRLVTRLITSPVTSAKAAFKKHPVLGILSIAASSILLFGIIAGVMIATGGIASIPILGGILASIPAVAANITAAGIFAGIATIFTAVVAGLKIGINKLFYPDRPQQENKNEPITVTIADSSNSEDEFIVVDSKPIKQPKIRKSPTSMSSTLLESQPSPKGSDKIKYAPKKEEEEELNLTDSFEFI